MRIIVEPSNLSLNDVDQFLKLQEKLDGSFTDYLTLELLTEVEQQDLSLIRNDFRRYLKAGRISEGMVNLFTIASLMRLAGFYDIPIPLTVEDVVGIAIEDEDRVIKGRMDILAINQAQATTAPPF